MPKRAVYAVLAWGAATATAMGVVWTGLDSVLPTAAAGPHVATVAAWPEQDAAVGPGAGPDAGPQVSADASAGASSAQASPGPTGDAPASAAGGGSGGSGSAGGSGGSGSSGGAASSGPVGSQRRYTTPGGTAVLTLYPDRAVLDAATPATGYSAKSWTNSDFLEVEFAPADGGTVYEVIATWNGTSPQVRTLTVGG